MQRAKGFQPVAVRQRQIGQHDIETIGDQPRRRLFHPTNQGEFELHRRDLLKQFAQQPRIGRIVFDQQDLDWLGFHGGRATARVSPGKCRTVQTRVR